MANLVLVIHSAEPRWWKGNLHTHSLWSDGDDFPEMITKWYKEQGYDFLAISDHNALQVSERWMPVGTNGVRPDALEKYVHAYGTNWTEVRAGTTNSEVRLKPLNEYRALFEEAGKFLLIASEELTDKFEKYPIHLNASNIRDYIPPQGGNSVREVMQNNVNAVLVQARTTGQRILPHLNHPNFGWAVTAEDIAALRGEHFFEIYNGHPLVRNEGDDDHASTEQMWDIALALRLSAADREPLYGLAVDDAHEYHRRGRTLSNAGRGWIFVRSANLTPEFLLKAMQAGDFYASTGVVLNDIAVSKQEIRIAIRSEPGVEYRTEFVGLRQGYKLASNAVTDKDGRELTRRYHASIGEVVAEVRGETAAYRFAGNELYVRARITSSKVKTNGLRADELEMAWTQPILR